MKAPWYVRLLTAMFLLLCSVSISAAEFHVRPDGDAAGNGSQTHPWNLAEALQEPPEVKPGDTLWLHEGTYRGGFVSRLQGTLANPITVRPVPGHRVVVDTNPRDERDNGLLLLAGSDTIFRDFEVNCSHLKRDTSIAGSWPSDVRRGSVDIRGDRIAAINLVVHDQASGFGFWSEGEGGEIYGCLIYNNGWQGPDRAHGHGIYVQNARGVKRIADNVVFHQFVYGIHAYGSDKASLKGLQIEGNIAFDNGCIARGNDRSPGIMVGGGSPARQITVRDNVVVGGTIRLGYSWGAVNEDAEVFGNYCDGGLVVRDFHHARIRKNTIVASSTVVQLEGAAKLLKEGLEWDSNEYYVTDGRWGECAVVEGAKRQGLSFAQWQKQTGLDAESKLTKGPPTKLRVIVRPNVYEAGRANVCIINPQGHAEVEVDLSGVLKPQQKFRVVSAKDVFGPPVVKGTYEGHVVRVPLTTVKPPAPIGVANAELPTLEPYFGAFIVLPER